MSSRSDLFRETFFIALGTTVVIIALIAGSLWVMGELTWVWFARVILAFAAVGLVAEVFLVQRALRVETIHRRASLPHRVDHMQGCTLALVVGAIVFGLLVCGALLDWVVELR